MGKICANAVVKKEALKLLCLSTHRMGECFGWCLKIKAGTGAIGRTYPLRTPRIRFITKKAPRTTIDTKYINCHELPIAS